MPEAITLQDSVADRMAVLGEPSARFETGANRPILLNELGHLWIVERGEVEIFTVPVESGKPAGARSHFLTIEPGRAFFNFDSQGTAGGFLAVAHNGAVLRRYDRAQVDRWLGEGDEEAVALLGRLLDEWIAAATEQLILDVTVRPRVDLVIAPGHSETLPAGRPVRTAKGVFWLRLERATPLLFVDLAEIDSSEGLCFPLSPAGWLTPAESIPATAFSTAELLHSHALWRGFGAFQTAVANYVLVARRLLQVDEINRLREKENRRLMAASHALDELSAVLIPARGRKAAPEQEEPGDLLLAAARLVGGALGIRVEPHPGVVRGYQHTDSLEAIARASRFRTRKTLLREGWWRAENGPLLAYLAEGHQPVALLQHGRRYRLHDPRKPGRSEEVTESLAAGLEPFAHMFYPPFPDRALRLWDVLRFGLKGHARELVLMALLGVLIGLFGAAFPLLTGWLFDVALPQRDPDRLLLVVVALAVAALTTAGLEIFRGAALQRIAAGMNLPIQAAVWDRLLRLPVPFFRRFTAGDLAMRAGAADNIRQILAGASMGAVMAAFSCSINVIVLCWIDRFLAGVAMALLGVALAFLLALNWIQLRYQRRIATLQGEISGFVLQFITGITKLRISATEDHAFGVWAGRYARQRRAVARARTAGNVLASFSAAFPAGCSAVLFFLVIGGKESGVALSIGEFLAFATAFVMLLAATLNLGTAATQIMKVAPLYERVRPVLEALPEANAQMLFPGQLTGQIELSHVTFRYGQEGPVVIKDVSIHIAPGEFVAIVGPSGSGKSTLLRLLLGFEQPLSGEVYYDGQPLSSLDVTEVRQQIGVVLQNGRLMPGDLYRNIAGIKNVTIEDAWEAARTAGMAEEIQAMPMGMHTIISEGGGAFSGGQRQRLMIARAVVGKPRILFFDEATSALDNRTQASVSASLDRLQSTRVVIAHRLSTIAHADRIYVLDKGEIVQAGTFAELERAGGIFGELIRLQQA